MVDLVAAVIVLVVGIVQLIVALGLAIAAIYMGINLLDKLTKGIEEVEELKKGNVAVGIIIASVVLSISIVIQSGVRGMTAGLGAYDSTKQTLNDYIVGVFVALGTGFLAVIIGMIFAVIVIYVALWVMQKMLSGMNPIEMVAEKAASMVAGQPQDLVKNIDLFEELKKDNRAVALMLAGILIGIAVVIQSGVAGLATAIGAIFA
ncbi:MAG TPA: DUF350 domain-containing protein [Thermoplasmata archaeon]|nr:DUF350 domain-containing protein [Thermoplasmata archaeon]